MKKEILAFARKNPVEFAKIVEEAQRAESSIKENLEAGAVFDGLFNKTTVRLIVARIGNDYSFLGLLGHTFQAWNAAKDGGAARYIMSYDDALEYLIEHNAEFKGTHSASKLTI